jgi:two-component system, sensor histidine kinase LadS
MPMLISLLLQLLRAFALKAPYFLLIASRTACGVALLVGAFVAPMAYAQQVPQPVILDAQAKRIQIDASSEYWIDDSGIATVAEVDARQRGLGVFKPRGGAERQNLDGKALWIRFDAQITAPNSHWFLELAQSSADDVSLHWRNAAHQWTSLRAGDVVPRAQWPVLDRFPMFQLSQERVSSSAYYLRIAHARVPFSAPLYIYRDTALVAQREIDHFFLGAYFGLVTLVSLVCLALARAMHDKSFFHYALYIGLIGIAQACFTGIAAQYIWPHATTWADLSNFFFPYLAVATCLWFVRSVIQPSGYSPTLDVFTLLLIAAQIIVTFVDLAFPSVIGFQTNNAITITVVLTIYTIVWHAWRRGDATARWLALGSLPVVLGIVPALLRNVGLVNTGFWTQYGSLAGSAIEMPILLYGLVLRSVLRSESRARAAGLPTQDPLTGLSNMRDLLRQIHGAMTRASRYRQQYSLVLIELTNHAWFTKEHGREIADRALVIVATRLQLIARDVDTAGRIDENHFILLLEGPCKPSYAAKVAAQIVASAHRPSNLLPVGASLKLRVTCALMPDPQALELGDDANAQLGWLVHSSESLEADPRKLVRTLNF